MKSKLSKLAFAGLLVAAAGAHAAAPSSAQEVPAAWYADQIVIAGLPANATTQSAFPSAAQEFSSYFWTDRMARAMDANRDGRVSREEFLAYMGAQYDTMDTDRKGVLTRGQFTDRTMMARTFTFPSSVSESGPNR